MLHLALALAAAEIVAEPFTAAGSFTRGVEGPACDRAGNLYAVNFERQGTIGKVTPQGEASLFAVLPNGGNANGMRLDSRGLLIVADYRGHAVWTLDPATGGFLEKLTADWKGAQFHQPNDVGIAGDDTIYFSDPDWKSRGGRLFMITAPPSRRTVMIEEGLTTPNGVTVSPDDRRVYVGQSSANNILVYDRRPDGALHNKRVLIDLAAAGIPKSAVPDGIRCDVKGNLWIAMHGYGRTIVVRPDGKLAPESVRSLGTQPANITFCGNTLYITEKEHGRIEKARVPYPGIR
ncbi:MAG: SMP-30/gluconolactonase/LRE family protein [Bryobacteraceae bacterium]